MIKRFFIVCAMLALAGCALNPTGSAGSAYAGNVDRPIAPRNHCDRIKVVCVDMSGPGLLQTLPMPTLALPRLPGLLTLPR